MARFAVTLLGCILLVAAQSFAQPGGPARAVHGLVVDGEDRPLAGVRVLAAQPNYGPGEITARVVETTSDERGRFTLQAGYIAVIAGVKDGYAVGSATAYGDVLLRLSNTPRTGRGRVVTADGKPVAGAEVKVTQLVPRGSYGYPGPGYESGAMSGLFSFLTTKSDAQGRFAIASLPTEADILLEATAPGMTSQAASVGDAAAEMTIVLQPEATISGRVTCGGKPLAGVEIYWYAEPTSPGPGGPGGPPGGGPPPPPPPPPPGMGRRWFGPPGAPGAPWRRPYYPSGPNRQLTGADGAFTIGRLPAGRITLIASPDEDLIPPELSPVTVKTGQKVQGYDILMAKGGTIRGKVVEAGTGKPVVGAIISNVAPQAGQEEYGPGYRYPHGPGYSAEDGETNRFGIYQLRLYPGTHSLYCTALEGAYELPAEPTRVVVEDDKPLPGINFVLKPAQPVRGVVCAPDGRPTAEVELIYTGEEDEQIPLEVGADGTFELPAGTWGMPQADERIPPALLATSKAKSWSAFVVGAPGQQSLKVPLQPGGFISFPVTDHNDKPLADFKVWVCGSYNEEGRYSITNTVSSAAGLVTLGPLPPGQMLQLVFDCPMVPLIVSQEWREPQPIMLRPGQHTQLTPMKVNPEGRSLKVFVGDEQQRPVKGAMVCAGGSEPLYTDDKGQVELKRLPIAGKVTVMALHPTESLFAAQTVDPDWGQWPGLLLKPYGTATGQIRTKDDKPLPRAIVYCSVAEDAELWNLGPLMGRFPGMYPGGEGETTTDDEGRFRVGSLIPGLRYEVMVAPPDGEMGPNVAGSFTATGGKDAQDVGIMTYEPAKAEE